MPDVAIYIPGRPVAVDTHPRVTITRQGAPVVTLPITSPRVEAANLAARWTTDDRFGQFPLLGLAGRPLPTRRLEVTVDEDTADRIAYGYETANWAGWPGALAEQCLDALEQLAAPGPPVVVAYSNLEAGLWRITDLSWTTTLRAPVDNHVLRADVRIELTQASDPPPIASRAPAAPPPPPPDTPAAPAGQRRHTVASGDTLWDLAQRYYGNGNQWRKIADANGIRDPRKLRVGTVLTIP